MSSKALGIGESRRGLGGEQLEGRGKATSRRGATHELVGATQKKPGRSRRVGTQSERGPHHEGNRGQGGHQATG